MFDIKDLGDNTYSFHGAFTAARVTRTEEFFHSLDSSCTLDFAELKYISSVGLGIIIKGKQQLEGSGHSLTLINLSSHLKDLFRVTGFDTIFDIEQS